MIPSFGRPAFSDRRRRLFEPPYVVYLWVHGRDRLKTLSCVFLYVIFHPRHPITARLFLFLCQSVSYKLLCFRCYAFWLSYLFGFRSWSAFRFITPSWSPDPQSSSTLPFYYTVSACTQTTGQIRTHTHPYLTRQGLSIHPFHPNSSHPNPFPKLVAHIPSPIPLCRASSFIHCSAIQPQMSRCFLFLLSKLSFNS